MGFLGLLQPLADGAKLILKETVMPSLANRFIFLLAPVLTFFLSLLSWMVIPFNSTNIFADLNIAVLFVFGRFLFRRLRNYYGWMV